jgi:hypothetical protein
MTKNQKRMVNVFLIGFVLVIIGIIAAVRIGDEMKYLPIVKVCLYLGGAMISVATVYSVIFPIKPHHKQ